MDPSTAERLHLHTLWAYQLSREYSSVVYQYRVPLQPASICVKPMADRWGSWDAQARRISLSAALIEQYAWDVVVEILKHEMAHQIVSEYFGVREAHGSAFARACDMLGVLPWAAAPSGELPRTLTSWRDRAMSAEQDKLLKKVQKLLALATSSNEHEAFLAMQRVREIYARYNLDALTAAEPDDVVHLVFCRKRRRSNAIEDRIFAMLTRHFYVRAIHCQTYDASDRCTYQAVEVIGRRENVLMAEYVYHFLHGQLTSLWSQQAAAAQRGKVAKNSFRLGVLAGFSQKLDQAAVRVTDARGETRSGHALMRRNQPVVAAYVERRHPRLTSKCGSATQRDPAAYQAGQAAGRNLTLHRAVHGAATQRGRLLTAGKPVS